MDHAVVIGAGIAGLASATALSRTFSQVTVVEPDVLPDSAVIRPGVPQGGAPHTLLPLGYRALQELLPGINRDLSAVGAQELDLLADIAWSTAHGWGDKVISGKMGLSISQPLLEWIIRQRVAPDVEFRQVRVTGLTVSGGRVRGVETTAGPIEADFVVDASGRRSHSSRWLTAHGYPTPRQSHAGYRLTYTSTIIARPPRMSADWRGVIVAGDEPRAQLMPIEGDRLICALMTSPDTRPGSDFVGFARSLRTPLIGDVVAAADEMSPIHVYGQGLSRRFHYVQCPDGFAVVGDALCTLNPALGRGMTVAFRQALLLREPSRPGLQAELAACADQAWASDVAQASGAEDSWLAVRLERAALTSARARRALFDYVALDSSASRLLRPDVLLAAFLPRPRRVPAPDLLQEEVCV